MMERQNNPISVFLSRYGDKMRRKPGNGEADAEIGISEDNIFSILNIEDKEVFHSRFLKYLIENHWESFVGNVLAKKCGMSVGALKYARCEYPCAAVENCPQAKQGRLDLYFETAECVVAVEVKWHAGEQPLQLLRYYDALKRQNGRAVKLFFLTPDGRPPATAECRERCDVACRRSLGEGEYFTLSFREISEWIAALRKGKAEREGYLLEQYREILCEEERKMAETENLSGFLKNPEDFETANKIARSFEKLCEQIRKVFFDALTAEIKRQAEKTDGKFVGVRAGKGQKQTIEILVRGMAPDGKEEETSVYCGYETNLYCHDQSGWWYITPGWFRDEICREEKNRDGGAKNDKNKIDVKNFGIYDSKTGNPVINWYYGGRDEETIRNIVKNMLRYFFPAD